MTNRIRKRKLVNRVQTKKPSLKAKKSNRFEEHINKEKLRVLGRKQKNDRGMPGVAKAKAIEKRKSTLLQEYKLLNKSNKFLDKRIGEKSHVMTNEEKAMARFTAVRVKAHNKKSVYNLADDELLTHRGQTLSEIEKFDDPRSEDEDSADELNTGKLDRQFVEDAHFGGGILKRTGLEGAKTHKELIDQLIAESKKRKAEKQKTKEVTLELTEKLDSEWKDLIPFVNKSKRTEDQADKPKIDDFDKIMQELRFEARGTVSDRLKSEEEIAKEEKEKLENFEKERLDRMKGFVEEKSSKPTHRSADDLDDDLLYESDTDYMLSYNDKGEANVEVDVEINGKNIAIKSSDSETEENEEAENKMGSDDEEVETDSEDNFSDLREDTSESESETDTKENLTQAKSNEIQTKNIKRTMESTTEHNNDNQKEPNEKELQEQIRNYSLKRKDIMKNITDTFSDLRDDSTESESEAETKETETKETQTDELRMERNNGNKVFLRVVFSEEKQLQKNIQNDLLKRKELIEIARREVPNIFHFPKSYESLMKTFKDESSSNQSVIIERIIKCNHLSVAEGNKGNMEILFAYLLQYMNDLFTDVPDAASIRNSFEFFKALTPQIYDVGQLISENLPNFVMQVIEEKQNDFRKETKKYPDFEVLIFLKLVSLLFTASDFRHKVVTPCFVFIEQMLNKCKVRNKRDISYGLFLSTLVSEYTTLSKRYLPAVINFLTGLLHMAIPKTGVKLIKVPPPFKSISSLLVLVENRSLDNIKCLQMDCTDLINGELDEEYKIRVVYNTLKLLKEFYDNFQALPSRVEIFDPVLRYLELLPTIRYPKEIKMYIEGFLKTLKNGKATRELNYLITEARKPKALRLYDPRIEEVYDGKRFKVQSKQKAERDKLMHKLKKETKGALREIRRDKAFLGRVKIHQRIQSDNERKEKVKRLYSEAAMQQSELNELDRKKKRKK